MIDRRTVIDHFEVIISLFFEHLKSTPCFFSFYDTMYGMHSYTEKLNHFIHAYYFSDAKVRGGLGWTADLS